MFVPAQLHEKEWRWIISFKQVHPISGELKSFRVTKLRDGYGMMRIHNLTERRKYAKRLVNQLNRELLPAGYPFEDLIELKENPMTILEALNLALTAKFESCKTNRSYTTYSGKVDVLIEFIRSKGWDNKFALDWHRPQCRLAMKWIEQNRDISNTTYNNYIEKLRSVFGEMVKDNTIPQNPWANMALRKQEPKKRRCLTDEERRVILSYFRENNYWMYIAAMLQYYCMIRPKELRGLKFSDFDLYRGTVKVRKEVSKMNKERTLTIPHGILKFFRIKKFTQHPHNYFVFGKKIRPGFPRQCGANEMYNYHRATIQLLHAKGEIHNLVGLHWYSWKDTGITNLSKLVSPYKLKDQTGHSTLEMLMKYYHKDEVNSEMKNIPIDIE